MTRLGTLSDEHRIAIGAARLGMTRAEYHRHVEAGEKWCFVHQEWHPVGAFSGRRTAADGLNNMCRRANHEAYVRKVEGYRS